MLTALSLPNFLVAGSPFVKYMANMPRGIRPPIGVYSRRIALGKLDGRRREAKLIRDLVDEFTAHVGGLPSAVEKRLIERAAVLHLRLALMDQQTAPGGAMSEKNAREYVCWHNAYVRTLHALGLKGAAAKPGPSLAEILGAVPTTSPGLATPTAAQRSATQTQP